VDGQNMRPSEIKKNEALDYKTDVAILKECFQYVKKWFYIYICFIIIAHCRFGGRMICSSIVLFHFSLSLFYILLFFRVENLYIFLIVLVNKQLTINRINELKN
jgi:hypothetical protein